jgi:hypothetical protein
MNTLSDFVTRSVHTAAARENPNFASLAGKEDKRAEPLWCSGPLCGYGHRLWRPMHTPGRWTSLA